MEAMRRATRALVLILALALVAGACSSAPADPPAQPAPPAGGASEGPAGGAGGAGGSGGLDEPLARVLAASDEALDADSMHMTFGFTIEAAGFELGGSGEADIAFGRELRQHMSFRYDSFPGMPQGMEAEMIIDGSTMYMRLPQLAETGLPTEWVKMDLSGSVRGFEDLMELGAGQNDPSNAFGYLQGAEDAVELGTETIDGVETTHYEVTVDLREALADVPNELRDEMRLSLSQFRRAFGDTTLPFEVWVDGDGLARRIVYRMASDGGAMGPFSMDMRVHISDYGEDFELDLPADRDVTDVTELVG
jgi:hypothetical protein